MILTTFARPGYLRQAMAAGAVGFLVKDGPVEGLADAIRRVLAAGPSSTPAWPRPRCAPRRTRWPRASATCSRPPRTGRASPTSPAGCFLSPSTVRNYLSAAIGKTGTRNQTEAALLARRNGWLA